MDSADIQGGQAASAFLSDQLNEAQLDAMCQLRSSSLREGERDNALGRNAFGQERGNASSHGLGLPGSCTGYDLKVGATVADDVLLFRRELQGAS